MAPTPTERVTRWLTPFASKISRASVHAFILDTRNYREFCHQYFDGQFLEHIPEIERKYDDLVRRTAEVIQANGFQVDWPLWEKDFSKCTPCHPGSSCH